jgi:four helix bundle protein
VFGYETLEIYKKAREYNLQIRSFLKVSSIDYPTEDQLRRASLSIVLNLAEGSGRFSKKDIRRFYVISRSSVHECAAILDLMHQEKIMKDGLFASLYKESEELSKILFKMIRNLSD